MNRFLSLVVVISSLFTAVTLAACETADAEQAPGTSEPAVRRVSITVGASGYTPSSVDTNASEPLALVFRRTTDQGCGQELVFPDHNIRRDLPLNEDVVVELTPEAGETINFTCGMGMYRGSVVAR